MLHQPSKPIRRDLGVQGAFWRPIDRTLTSPSPTSNSHMTVGSVSTGVLHSEGVRYHQTGRAPVIPLPPPDPAHFRRAGYLGTPGRTRTSSLRIRSPSRHNPLTSGYTQEPSRSKGFKYSTVRTALHQFSIKRVLSASWRASRRSRSLTSPASTSAGATQRRSDSTPYPNWSPIRTTVPCGVPSTLRSSNTRRTAWSFSCGIYRRVVGFPGAISCCHNSHLFTLESHQKSQGEPDTQPAGALTTGDRCRLP
jgi:hypothetical protein